MRVRGHAGDTIAVLLQAESGTRGTMGADAALRVEVDGARAELPLRDLTAGATLYRFAEDRSVTVRYHLLGRVASDVAPGRFLLEQRTSGAVENVQTPWIPKDRLVPGSAASVGAADPGPECFITAGAGDCGGVSYTVVSFIESLYIGGTFTSRSNTGPSGSITITFSKPVPSVTVTIFDPTYAGNTVSTVGGGGASFSYSGQPGVNVPDTKTVTGEITQVHLVPADNDYVAYTVSFVPPPPPGLAVTCSPAPVVRDSTARCVVKFDDSTEAGTVVERSARGASPYVTAANTLVSEVMSEPLAPGDSVVWEGRAAVNTWVTFRVQTTAGGATLSDSARINVQSRDWRDPPVPKTTIPFDLTPEFDTSFSQLPPVPITNDPKSPTGQGFPEGSLGQHLLNRSMNWIWTFTGPDVGWHYYRSPPTPKADSSAIYIHPWLQSGSAFYSLQIGGKAPKGRKYCQAADVDSLHARVRRHELAHHAMAKLFYSTKDVNTMNEPLTAFFNGDPVTQRVAADSARTAADLNPLGYAGQHAKWQNDSVQNNPAYAVVAPNCVFRLP